MIYKEFYSAMGWSIFPIIGLIFFLAAFALVLMRTFAFSRKADFDAIAALPLDDSTPALDREVKP